MSGRSTRINVKKSQLAEVTHELYSRNAELAVRNKTLSLLRRIDEITMVSLETDRMTANIADVLAEELGFEVVALGTVEKSKRHLRWKAISCLHEGSKFCRASDQIRPTPLSRSNNLCALVLKHRRPLSSQRLSDVFAPAFLVSEIESHQKGQGIKSVLVYPIQTNGSPIGVLAIAINRLSRDLTRYERETIDGVLDLVTIAIQKAQIYESLRRTTKQLAKANKKLKELDALKTEFLSIASHQLRTPLAVIKGYASMISEGMLGKMDPKQKDALGKISVSTEQLIALVNHLLDVSRIEAGRLVVRSAPVSASSLTASVVEFLRPKAEEKRLKLAVDIQPDLFALADEEKFKEVLMNFIDNAIKYTPSGSVRVHLAAEDGAVRVAVEDTGYGLTATDREQLFEKFARGSASKQVQVSTGLGLYVCRRLVEAMGGRIWAESKGPGKGSTFLFTLPAAVASRRKSRLTKSRPGR